MLLNSLPVHTYDASLGYKSTIELKIDDKVSSQLEMPCKVEILVENMGRSNYGGTVWQSRKGINIRVIKLAKLMKFVSNGLHWHASLLAIQIPPLQVSCTGLLGSFFFPCLEFLPVWFLLPIS